MVQAPAPARLIPGGLPTEATIAHVLVSEYADHLPLYRQAQIYSRQGIDLDRSPLADWVGRVAFELCPVFDVLIADLKRSTKLFMPSRQIASQSPAGEQTRPGPRCWILGGARPRPVTSGRWLATTGHGAEMTRRAWPSPMRRVVAAAMPNGYWTASAASCGSPPSRFALQIACRAMDGYAGDNRLIAPDRVGPEMRLAYCRAHARRKLVEITRTGSAPIAEGGVKRIGELYRIEAEIRGSDPVACHAARQEHSAPITAELEAGLNHHRARVASKSPLGEALEYIAKYWDGLCLFLTDGRVELDSNAVERTIRPIALNRKNARFAGHDAGAQARAPETPRSRAAGHRDSRSAGRACGAERQQPVPPRPR